MHHSLDIYYKFLDENDPLLKSSSELHSRWEILGTFWTYAEFVGSGHPALLVVHQNVLQDSELQDRECSQKEIYLKMTFHVDLCRYTF